MLLPRGIPSTTTLPAACACRSLCFWHWSHLQVLAWFKMTLKKELATALMQLTRLVVGGLPLVKRTSAIPCFSFLSLQVANSCNCHFSCRALYLALQQVVLSLASVYNGRIDVFLYFLVAPCPFNSVVFLCCPAFTKTPVLCVIYIPGAVQCMVQWMENTQLREHWVSHSTRLDLSYWGCSNIFFLPPRVMWAL